MCTHVLAPVASGDFLDIFAKHAFRIFALLHDPSIALIDGAKKIIKEAQADWVSKRRDATSDSYSLLETLGEDLAVPCSPPPTNNYLYQNAPP